MTTQVLCSKKLSYGTAKLIQFNPNSNPLVTMYRVTFVQKLQKYSTQDRANEKKSHYIITDDLRTAALCFEGRFGRNNTTKLIVLTPKLVNNLTLVASKTKQKDLTRKGKRPTKARVRLGSRITSNANKPSSTAKTEKLKALWAELIDTGYTVLDAIEYLESENYTRTHIGRTMPSELRGNRKGLPKPKKERTATVREQSSSKRKTRSDSAKRDEVKGTSKQGTNKSSNVDTTSEPKMIKVSGFNIEVPELPPEKKEVVLGKGFVSGRFRKFY